MFSKHRQQSTGMPAGTSCLWTALSTPEFFTGRWAKSPKGCGPQTAIGRAPVEQAGRLCPQPDWAGRHLFPWAMRVSGVPDVSVTVTFHSGQVGNCLLKTSICIVSSQPWGQKKNGIFCLDVEQCHSDTPFFFLSTVRCLLASVYCCSWPTEGALATPRGHWSHHTAHYGGHEAPFYHQKHSCEQSVPVYIAGLCSLEPWRCFPHLLGADPLSEKDPHKHFQWGYTCILQLR